MWIAAHEGHDDAVVKLLIDRGADFDQANQEGTTPLKIWWCAAKGGHEAVAKLLIDGGADINQADHDV